MSDETEALFDQLDAWKKGKLDQNEEAALFQELVDTGADWAMDDDNVFATVKELERDGLITVDDWSKIAPWSEEALDAELPAAAVRASARLEPPKSRDGGASGGRWKRLATIALFAAAVISAGVWYYLDNRPKPIEPVAAGPVAATRYGQAVAAQLSRAVWAASRYFEILEAYQERGAPDPEDDRLLGFADNGAWKASSEAEQIPPPVDFVTQHAALLEALKALDDATSEGHEAFNEAAGGYWDPNAPWVGRVEDGLVKLKDYQARLVNYLDFHHVPLDRVAFDPFFDL